MSRFKIVTIEREYASGGREVGKKLADALGVPCYGEEILEMAAQRYGTTADNLRELEETATNSLVYSLYMMSHATTGAPTMLSSADQLAIVEGEIIRQLADETPCVIVGRCAGCVLHERDDVLRVFIRADKETRKQRAISVYNDPAATVDAVLKKADKRRSNYYGANSDLRWNDMAGYHMVLDSGKLGTDACAEIIAKIVK